MSMLRDATLVNEPLSPDIATRLIHQIVREGDVAWTKHAFAEISADGMTTSDCLNVMRAGAITQPADLERGTWRYRIHTNRMCVCVAFRSETELVVITAWRIRR
jgi:hypothetical protein